jgi:hypothetical protein
LNFAIIFWGLLAGSLGYTANENHGPDVIAGYFLGACVAAYSVVQLSKFFIFKYQFYGLSEFFPLQEHRSGSN